MDPRAPAVKVLVCAQSDVGRARQTNEDACSITELETGSLIDAMGKDQRLDVGHKGVLLAVSDGMGGHQAGEVASALVIESLSRELTQEKQGPLHKQLEDAVHRANRRVHNAARTADRHGMGATLTAVFIKGTEAFIAEVGDSRGYLLRNGRLRQITRDQSMVQMLVDQGVLTPQDARKAPGKNVILQAVGLAPDVRVAIGRLELRRGDRLLLCSDGVSNQINDDELRQILTRSEPREACETMIALANERGGEDNETVIVADVLGEDLNEPMEFETVTSTFEVMQAFEAKPSKPRRRTGMPLRTPTPSDFADPKKPSIEPVPEPEEAAPVEMPVDAPPAKISATPPPAMSRTTAGARAESKSDVATRSDSKAESKSDGATKAESKGEGATKAESTGDGATKTESKSAGKPDSPANASGSMPAMQTEPEKRGWVQSLLDRLSRTKTRQ